jgi:hypothetical protein
MAEAMYETEMFGVATPATATATTISTATYSSEGPTLPILGGAGEHGVPIAVAAERGSGTRHAAPQAGGRGSKKRKHTDVAGTPSSMQKPVTLLVRSPELEPLRMPWLLLPPELLEALYKRLGETFWHGNCVPVVMTRNQNIRSGVNKLKAYLGAGARNPAMDVAEDVVEVLKSERLVVAVSAMGEVTTKLVGILEVLRRVVGMDGHGVGEREEWCMYTSLSSRMVEKKDKRRLRSKEDRLELVGGVALTKGSGVEMGKEGDEEDASFEPTATRKETEETGEKTPKEQSVPVLTVWLSRTSIPEFENEFGEEKFAVVKVGEMG